jgi:head-tail adaptor
MRPMLHRVIVQRPSSSQDEYGDWPATYRVVRDDFAAVEPLRGRELMDLSQKYAEITHRIRMRYVQGTRSDVRVLYPGAYATLSVLPVTPVPPYPTGSTEAPETVEIEVSDGRPFPPVPFTARVGPMEEIETLFSVGESSTGGIYWEGYEVTPPYELIRVSAVSGANSTAWTVYRAQDGTTERTLVPGDDVHEMIPAEVDAVLPVDRRTMHLLARVTR